MTEEEFKQIALNVLLRQKFADIMPLFNGESLDDFEVSDNNGGMDLNLFLEELYRDLTECE